MKNARAFFSSLLVLQRRPTEAARQISEFLLEQRSGTSDPKATP